MINNDFTGILTKISSKAKNTDVVMNFTITHQERGPFPEFLNDYADEFNEENIKTLFGSPIKWKSIRLDANRNLAIKFDNLDLIAKLIGITVRLNVKKTGEMVFVYNMMFENEFDTDITPVFMQFLNQKAPDENGKPKKIEFDISITSAMKELDEK